MYEYSNHADDPNCLYQVNELSDKGLPENDVLNPYGGRDFFELFTIKEIEKGAEMRISYDSFLTVSAGLRTWGFFTEKTRENILFAVDELMPTCRWISGLSENTDDDAKSTCKWLDVIKSISDHMDDIKIHDLILLSLESNCTVSSFVSRTFDNALDILEDISLSGLQITFYAIIIIKRQKPLQKWHVWNCSESCL